MALFEVKNLKASFYKNGILLTPFQNVSFALEPGRIYNLIGPSGSGKSTLLNACARMIKCDNALMWLDGINAENFSPSQWRRHVCLVPQQASLIGGSVRDNLLFPWTLKINANTPKPNDETLQALLSLASLDDIELDHNAAQLSGGQAARVSLLRAFVTRPRVLLLDEVEAALDDESAHAISRLTRAQLTSSTTCLRIRHRAEDGYAFGSFTLNEGVLTYADYATTPHNTPLFDNVQNDDESTSSVLDALPHRPLEVAS